LSRTFTRFYGKKRVFVLKRYSGVRSQNSEEDFDRIYRINRIILGLGNRVRLWRNGKGEWGAACGGVENGPLFGRSRK
jgi:hypothetical protein